VQGCSSRRRWASSLLLMVSVAHLRRRSQTRAAGH